MIFYKIEYSGAASKSEKIEGRVETEEDVDEEIEEDDDDYEIILDSSKLPASNTATSTDINK